MKKIICFLSFVILLFGCQQRESIPELNDYYLSITKSSEDEYGVYFQNVSFDFETLKTVESESVERNSQYPLIVYDQKYNRYIYSAKDENTNDDQVYVYDLNTKKETHIDMEIWGVNYIIVRDNDYIVVAVKNNTQLLSLFSIDKETLSCKEISFPNDIHDDMSIWQVAYIPQNDGLILQAYSISEEWKIRDQWNTEVHDANVDLLVPFYHYLYTDSQFEYLFSLEMPQSLGVLSNGKDILVAQNSVNDEDDKVIRYNIENKEMTTEEHAKTLNLGFYLDDEGRYVYAIGDNLHKYDTE